MEGGTMRFTNRELEVIGQALKELHESVQAIDKNEPDDHTAFKDYLYEINKIQTRITDNMPRETLN